MRQLKISNSITSRSEEAIAKYLAEISRYPLLSQEEEVALAQAVARGGEEGEKAKEKMVNSNLRFVVSVAKQYQHHGVGLTDLINEGNIGLLKAVERYDVTRGFKFISYAVWWIRQSIMQAIAEQSRLVKLPLNQVNSVNKINKMLSKFEQENERRPSIDEIAENIDLDEEKIAEAIRNASRHVSMDAPFSNGDENSLLDVIPNADAPLADNLVEMESLRDEIAAALKTLNERERKVLEAFYGIGQPEMTLDEIGRSLGLTRERVRQIRQKAIRQLRKNTKNKALKAYLGR